MKKVLFRVPADQALTGTMEWKQLRYRLSESGSRSTENAHFIVFCPVLARFDVTVDLEPAWKNRVHTLHALRQGVDVLGYMLTSDWTAHSCKAALSLTNGKNQDAHADPLKPVFQTDKVVVLLGKNLCTVVGKSEVNNSEWK